MCSGADTCDGAGVCKTNDFSVGTDCGVCKQCNGSGTCGNGYEGLADPSGCSGLATSCSGADVCSGGACQTKDFAAGTDCGVCKECNGTGTCGNGYEGVQDPSGCTGTCQTCKVGVCGTSGTLTTCYQDSDGDGYGNPAAPMTVCGSSCPTGYKANNTDCNDVPSSNGFNVHPGQTAWFGSSLDISGTNFDYDCSGTNEMENGGFVTGYSCMGSCPAGCFSIGGNSFQPAASCGQTYQYTIGCGGPGGLDCQTASQPNCNGLVGPEVMSCSNVGNACPLVAVARMRCH